MRCIMGYYSIVVWSLLIHFFVFLVVNGLLITLQNCTEILRNLTFVAQLAYICIRLNKGREQQKKVFIFLEQLLLQKANF